MLSTTTGYNRTTNSCLPVPVIKYAIHLAATLKKLLTILLLLLMVCNMTGYFYCKHYEPGFVQETKETKEKCEDKKETKEYISFAPLTSSAFIINQVFPVYLFTEKPSPVIDHLSPPPDMI